MKNIHFTETCWDDESYNSVYCLFDEQISFLKSLFIFINSLSLVIFKRKLLFYESHTEDLIMFICLDFKLNCLIPSQIYYSFFLRMEIFFYIATFCMLVNLINCQIKYEDIKT